MTVNLDNLPFKRGEIVYLHTDREQLPYQVVAIIIGINGIVYRVASVSGGMFECYELELSKEKSMLFM